MNREEYMKKPELLAPAGNFEALQGAVAAGADAVYLGGERYGARAYADNFTQDEICEGIRFAHILGRKIYLTVNTLVREEELDALFDFVGPFYESGLDGVIVQDLGVLRFLRIRFPELAIHASTQMTLTGSGGAQLMKREGVSRIVPARELSLEEIVAIKRESGLEIESFIHGAMCYCYSGQCLLSSLLGGRSGNRGRCAQPCRLPWEASGEKECYPLSMRDMCTIEILPLLIQAGIDSFKIEGRMKKPAYATGVTAIYRKYIDLYYRDQKHYQVAREDLELLQSLYIRSQTGDGYYRRHNGREMISLSSPAYTRTSPELLASIQEKYIRRPPCRRARARILLRAGSPACLTLTLLPERGRDEERLSGAAGGKDADESTPAPEREAVSVTVRGDVVQRAQKQPLTEEKIREQIRKSGESLIGIHEVIVEREGEIFLPVRSLNELRRTGVCALEQELARRQGPDLEKRQLSLWGDADNGGKGEESARGLASRLSREALSQQKGCPSREASLREISFQGTQGRVPAGCSRERLHVSVRTPEQLRAALLEGPGRIYVDHSLFHALPALVKEAVPHSQATELYGATPYIVRRGERALLEKGMALVEEGLLGGILVRNLESYAFFEEKIPGERLVLDTGLSVWNRQALQFWENRAGEFYLPAECNGVQWQKLLAACPNRRIRASAVIYGRQPVMVSANCLKKTFRGCAKESGVTWLKDRYGKRFPVCMDCLCCYNVIYNSVPLSLHRQVPKLTLEGSFRLDLTLEDQGTAQRLIRYFGGLGEEYTEPFYRDYTTGHYKRGVE